MKFKLLNIVLLTALLFSCGTGNNHAVIPDVYVNFQIFPNSINYIAPGGWLTIANEGVKGIIIYRQDQYNFIAYERACPYDPDMDCAIIEVDSVTFTLIDSCCMSRFLFLDGSPISGPAIRSLKQYRAEFDGTTLLVTNTLNY